VLRAKPYAKNTYCMSARERMKSRRKDLIGLTPAAYY